MSVSVSAPPKSAVSAARAARLVPWTKPPTLPRELYSRSLAGALGFIGFALALWLVPGALATWLSRDARFPLWALAPVVTALCFVAGQGLHLTGWVGHEGFHFNLFRGRLTNAVVGVLTSSATVVFLQTGVAIEHFNHHRYTNTERDPDLRLFGKQRSFWTRALLTRSRANRAFFCNAWRLARGLPLAMDERGLPLPRATYARLSQLNFACCLLWLSGYVALFVHDPRRAVCSVLAPLLFANLYSGIRPYLEHSNTDERLLSCARSRTHWLFVLWYFGNSFHLEHHLYPSVPCYRLRRVHRFLLDQGFLTRHLPSFDPAGPASYRWAFAPHQYGTLDPLIRRRT